MLTVFSLVVVVMSHLIKKQTRGSLVCAVGIL